MLEQVKMCLKMHNESKNMFFVEFGRFENIGLVFLKRKFFPKKEKRHQDIEMFQIQQKTYFWIRNAFLNMFSLVPTFSSSMLLNNNAILGRKFRKLIKK